MEIEHIVSSISLLCHHGGNIHSTVSGFSIYFKKTNFLLTAKTTLKQIWKKSLTEEEDSVILLPL